MRFLERVVFELEDTHNTIITAADKVSSVGREREGIHGIFVAIKNRLLAILVLGRHEAQKKETGVEVSYST